MPKRYALRVVLTYLQAFNLSWFAYYAQVSEEDWVRRQMRLDRCVGLNDTTLRNLSQGACDAGTVRPCERCKLPKLIGAGALFCFACEVAIGRECRRGQHLAVVTDTGEETESGKFRCVYCNAVFGPVDGVIGHSPGDRPSLSNGRTNGYAKKRCIDDDDLADGWSLMLRLSEEEGRVLEYMAEVQGMSPGQFVRWQSGLYRFRRKLTEREVRDLSGCNVLTARHSPCPRCQEEAWLNPGIECYGCRWGPKRCSETEMGGCQRVNLFVDRNGILRCGICNLVADAEAQEAPAGSATEDSGADQNRKPARDEGQGADLPEGDGTLSNAGSSADRGSASSPGNSDDSGSRAPRSSVRSDDLSAWTEPELKLPGAQDAFDFHASGDRTDGKEPAGDDHPVNSGSGGRVKFKLSLDEYPAVERVLANLQRSEHATLANRILSDAAGERRSLVVGDRRSLIVLRDALRDAAAISDSQPLTSIDGIPAATFRSQLIVAVRKINRVLKGSDGA